MNLCLCSDFNYIKYLKVTINSIILSNKNEEINFYLIIDKTVTDNNKKEIACLYSNNRKIKVFFINAENELLKKFPLQKHISTATYYRILLPSILPETIDKILYVDSDILCVDKISELYNTTIENYSVCAVRDAFNDDITFYNRLDYPVQNGYFNAGVLLINLKYWRKNNIMEKSLEYISNNPNRCLLSDQDALNKILNGTVLWTNFRYNYLITFFDHIKNEYFSDIMLSINYKKSLTEAMNKPCFIHFVTNCKPWHKNYKKSFKYLYKYIYEITNNGNLKYKYSIKGLRKIKWQLKFILTSLKIKKFENVIQDETYKNLEIKILNNLV